MSTRGGPPPFLHRAPAGLQLPSQSPAFAPLPQAGPASWGLRPPAGGPVCEDLVAHVLGLVPRSASKLSPGLEACRCLSGDASFPPGAQAVPAHLVFAVPRPWNPPFLQGAWFRFRALRRREPGLRNGRANPDLNPPRSCGLPSPGPCSEGRPVSPRGFPGAGASWRCSVFRWVWAAACPLVQSEVTWPAPGFLAAAEVRFVCTTVGCRFCWFCFSTWVLLPAFGPEACSSSTSSLSPPFLLGHL